MKMTLKFVGREGELESLKSWLSSSEHNIAFILGKMGSGKSTLLKSFLLWIKKQGVPYASGIVKDNPSSYSPLDQITKHMLNLDNLDKNFLKDRWIPILKFLYPASSRSSKITIREKICLYREILLFFKYILDKVSQGSKPLLVVMDDLENASFCSIQMIYYLLHKSRGLPIKWLVSSTKEPAHLFSNLKNQQLNSDYTIKPFNITLNGLTSTHAVEAFPNLDDPSIQDFIKKLCEESSGNPLFIYETLNYFIHDVGISSDSKSLSVELFNSGLVPKSFEELFEMRYLRLNQEENKILWIISLFDRPVETEELLVNPSIEQSKISQVLSELVQRKLLKEIKISNRKFYDFHHSFWRQHLRQRIPEKEKLEIQKQLKTWYEAEFKRGNKIYGFALAMLPAEIIDPLSALDYYEWTAKEYNAVFDMWDSVHFYRKWLETWTTLSSEEQIKISNLKKRVTVLKAMSELYVSLQMWDDAEVIVKEYINDANVINDETNYIRGYNFLGNVYWLQKRFDEALETYEKALSIALESHNPVLAADSYNNIGLVYSIWENYDRARESFFQSLALLEGTETEKVNGDCHMNLALTYLHEFDYTSGLDHAHKAYRDYSNVNYRAGMGVACTLAGRINLLKGEYKKAGILLLRGLRFLEEDREYHRVVLTRILYGTYLMQAGQFDIARIEFGKSLIEAQETDFSDMELMSRIRLNNLDCLLGKLDIVEKEISGLYPLPSSIGNPENRFEILKTFCHIVLEQGGNCLGIKDSGAVFRELIEQAKATNDLHHQAWAHYLNGLASFRFRGKLDENHNLAVELVQRVKDESLKAHLRILELEVRTHETRGSIDIPAIMNELKEILESANDRGDWVVMFRTWIQEINFLKLVNAVELIDKVESSFMDFFKESFSNISKQEDRLGLRLYVSRLIGEKEIDEGEDMVVISQESTLNLGEISEQGAESARAVEEPEINTITLESDELSSASTPAPVELGMESIPYELVKDFKPVQGPLVARCKGMKKIVEQLSEWDSGIERILIAGEMGSGKFFLVSVIHGQYVNEAGPLVSFDCSAQPDELVEKELMGIKRGWRSEGHKPLLERLVGGTLYLDGIENLSKKIQKRLLSYLKKKVTKKREIPILISGTCENIYELVDEHLLLPDLISFLGQVQLRMPSLRERKDDFTELINVILEEEAIIHGREKFKLSGQVINVLREFTWPENVSQLRRFISDLYHLKDGEFISMDDIPEYYKGGFTYSTSQLPKMYKELKIVKKEFIHRVNSYYLGKVKEQCHGDMDAMAKISGLSPERLIKLLKKYDLIEEIS